MMSAIDYDAFWSSRPWSDFDIDVWADDVQIASVKTFDAAGTVAAERWYRETLAQPLIVCDTTFEADPPEGPPIVIIEASDPVPPADLVAEAAALMSRLSTAKHAIPLNDLPAVLELANLKRWLRINRIWCRAFTRWQRRAHMRYTLCPACHAWHHPQVCGEIRALLMAEAPITIEALPRVARAALGWAA